MVSQVIANRYVVGQKIGSGGMGNVFRGQDQKTDVPIAIKVLKSELANSEMIARFVREGEALRQLNHPNIVALLDAVEENHEHYLIMELVEGGALDMLLRQTPQLPISQVLNLALDLTDALTRAHRLNIVHRDIKPANVLIAKDGMPRLTDFGIAHVVGSDITETGSIIGTAAYIAPELLRGDPADARSDIWSLGVMLFEMLVGKQPFRAENPGALIYAILSEPLPDLESLRPDAPSALIDLINRMLTKNPAERIPRMRLVGVELEALISGSPVGVVLSDSVQLGEVGLPSRFATPSPAPTSALRNNLPVQTTPFVGREHELDELAQLVRDNSVRLLTILATGGMGKTRLSLEVGRNLLRPAHGDPLFESGIYFVDLTPLTVADNIVQTVAEAVGCAFQQDGREAKQQLLDYLREKNTLLLMDNFEHVIAGRSLVQEILQVAPLVKILATSREKLNLSAETVFVLSGMEFPEWETPEDALEYGAVKLFMQSARRVRSDFQLEAGDLAYVARICRTVQGTPLGILLAAAWLEALSPREISEEIDRSLDFLETEMQDIPERQRSLRAVFEYSWNLLTEKEQALFAQFSVFRGGFTREAAQQITGTNLLALSAMINKSLLRRDNITGRYDIHELVRQYAEEKLKQLGDITPVYKALSHYYAGLLSQLESKLKGQGQLEALTLIETDFENIRTAWNEAVRQMNAEAVQQTMEGLYLFLTFRNRFMDGEQLFRTARQAWKAGGDNPPLLAGQVLVRYPEHPPVEHLQQGLAIAEQHHDAREIAFCQRLLGHWLSHSEFNHEEGIPLLQASLKGYQALGDKFYMAQVLDDLGWSLNLMMQQDKQLASVKQSLDLRREIGDKIGVANSLRNLGGAVGGFFDLTGNAYNYWEEAKKITYDMNDRLGIAWNASLQAANLIFKGEFDGAMKLVDESYPHAADVNDVVVKGFIQILRGIIVALRDEDYDKARSLINESFSLETDSDFRMLVGPFGLTIVACGTETFLEFLTYASKFSNTPFRAEPQVLVPFFAVGRVAALAESGDYARATILMSAFLEKAVSHVGARFPTEWATRWGFFNRLRTKLENALGPEAFEEAWAKGKELTLEEMSNEVLVLFGDAD